MEKEEIRNILSKIMPREPVAGVSPTDQDWKVLQDFFKTELPHEFISFVELMSEYAFPGDILKVQEADVDGSDTILSTYQHERKEGLWPPQLIPFYSVGNGDYFCLSAVEGNQSAVYYIYHEDMNVERYSNNFEEWIKDLPDFLS
ncbi:MAG: SMI1 / KNR4 family protein [Geobacteraceae bacterium GWC2_55_20]|nr:MAG: SMI1 / KNR4 family protein [Geobacteraceae bacterium GWC2_55_20]OGU23913.1 MAG: SMI1 / KNR4 family protein [Geobacteraceae bacterium GWF2_54_21]HBA73086.1 SMI1 / KNR4 family protein [Geobacter sp.]